MDNVDPTKRVPYVGLRPNAQVGTLEDQTLFPTFQSAVASPTPASAPDFCLSLEGSKIDVLSFRTNPESSFTFKYTDSMNCLLGLQKVVSRSSSTFNTAPLDPSDPSRGALRGGIFFASVGFLEDFKPSHSNLEDFISQFLSFVTRQYKLDSSAPFFQRLDIALRRQLFDLMLEQEKQEIAKSVKIQKKFPSDLGDRESTLRTLVTKSGFYHSHNPNFCSEWIPQECLKGVIVRCQTRTIEAMPPQGREQNISNKMQEFFSKQPSITAQCFEASIRLGLIDSIIAFQANCFRKQFDTTGRVDLNEVRKVASGIEDFSPPGTSFPECIKNQLLVQILGFDPRDQEAVKGFYYLIDLEASTPQEGYFSRFFNRSQNSAEIAANKKETIRLIATELSAKRRDPSIEDFELLDPIAEDPIVKDFTLLG